MKTLIVLFMLGLMRLAYAFGMADCDAPNYLVFDATNGIYCSTTPYSVSNVTHSLVSSTSATGWQVSATRSAIVQYSLTIQTTATIAGGQAGSVVLETAATNSTTPSDWTVVAGMTNGQALSLALTLQSIQPIGSGLLAFVPAGYYVRLRQISTTGAPTFTYSYGQEMPL